MISSDGNPPNVSTENISAGSGNDSESQIDARSREKNKENAKRTRDRKKALINTLQKSVRALCEEATKDESESHAKLSAMAAEVPFNFYCVDESDKSFS